MKGNGVRAEQLQIDWSELMRFKRTFTEPVPKNREARFAKAGITTLHGRARFVGRSSVQVGEDVLEGRYVVVATGQEPAELRVQGQEHLTTSEQFLELDNLPRRIVFIGGGYIGFEFGHVAVRAGSQVTILHRGDRPLPLFDPDLVDQIVARSRELGIDIQLGAEAEGVERKSDHYIVRASTSGQRREFEADLVVHSAGRVPEIRHLNLDIAEVEWDKRGVRVNEFVQSVSNPAVYAAGDAAATGGPPLTPVADYEGTIVAANLLKGNHQEPDYRGIPTVVYTIPSLASVGLGERQAREDGLKFRVKREMTSTWYSARRVGEKYSGYKVLVEEATDRILGAHLLGTEAGEIINLFALAIRFGLRAPDLEQMVFSYPTNASDVPYMF
jgi:glutathione reductase (NADPH)